MDVFHLNKLGKRGTVLSIVIDSTQIYLFYLRVYTPPHSTLITFSVLLWLRVRTWVLLYFGLPAAWPTKRWSILEDDFVFALNFCIFINVLRNESLDSSLFILRRPQIIQRYQLRLPTYSSTPLRALPLEGLFLPVCTAERVKRPQHNTSVIDARLRALTLKGGT